MQGADHGSPHCVLYLQPEEGSSVRGPASRCSGCVSAGELLSRQERKDITLGHAQQSLPGSRLLVFTAPDPTGLFLPWGRGPERHLVEVADDTKETLLNADECVRSPSAHSTRFPGLRRPERGRKEGFCQPWAVCEGGYKSSLSFTTNSSPRTQPLSPQTHTDIKAWEL